MASRSNLLFSGLGRLGDDVKEQAFVFGELGAGAFAGVYLGDVVGSLAEGSSFMQSSPTFTPTGKTGQYLIAVGQCVLGGTLGYFIAKKGSRPLGYGFGAGMIGAGLNRAILVAMNGAALPGVKPWAYNPALAAGSAPGTAGFGAAPILVTESQRQLSAAPVLVNELDGVGDPDDANLPFLA
jgi:hypothetical protein